MPPDIFNPNPDRARRAAAPAAAAVAVADAEVPAAIVVPAPATAVAPCAMCGLRGNVHSTYKYVYYCVSGVCELSDTQNTQCFQPSFEYTEYVITI